MRKVAGTALAGISIYVQLYLEDTPAFKELEGKRRQRQIQARMSPARLSDQIDESRSPILEALRLYPKRIALAAGAFISIQVTF